MVAHRYVAELDDENASSCSVFGNFEELDDTGKAGVSCKLRCDLGERHLEDLRDHDLARRKCISAAYLHMRSLPQANRRRDLASANAIPKTAKELHVQLPSGPVRVKCAAKER